MDAVKLVVDLLGDALTVPVFSDMPRNRPARCVSVDLDGDSSTPYLLLPRIALTCWGTSDSNAHGIALSAVEALRDAAIDHPYLSSAQLESMSRDEWGNTGQGRYLAILSQVINVDE